MAKTKKGTKTKAAKPEVVEEDDDEVEDLDEELEELEDDEAEDTAPKKKKGAAAEVEFGAAQLAALASEGRDKPIKARDLRTLLRKMARDGRLQREITPGNRTRYNWSGPNDPEVKAILKALKSGELEQGKAEALAKLKENKARKDAEKAAASATGKKKTKKKAAPVVEDDDDEDDDE